MCKVIIFKRCVVHRWQNTKGDQTEGWHVPELQVSKQSCGFPLQTTRSCEKLHSQTCMKLFGPNCIPPAHQLDKPLVAKRVLVTTDKRSERS